MVPNSSKTGMETWFSNSATTRYYSIKMQSYERLLYYLALPLPPGFSSSSLPPMLMILVLEDNNEHPLCNPSFGVTMSRQSHRKGGFYEFAMTVGIYFKCLLKIYGKYNKYGFLVDYEKKRLETSEVPKYKQE